MDKNVDVDSKHKELLLNRPQNLHKGVKGDFDLERKIDEFKCSAPYYSLESCLAENDRSWVKCQSLVQALKKCNEANK